MGKGHVMHRVQKENGEAVERLYRKDGKVVVFESEEEAEDFAENKPLVRLEWWWSVPAERGDGKDRFIQPASAIHLIERRGNDGVSDDTE
jgi:hypothetical protein